MPTPAAHPATLRRVFVVGTSGSGKTTLAANLARALGSPHVEADAIFWGPNWTELPRSEFHRRLTAATAADRWVMCGNIPVRFPDLLPRATAVVWLDYPLPFILARLARRTARRWYRKEELWAGNRENLRSALFSRDSLFLFAIHTHYPRTRHWRALHRSPPQGLTVVRLTTPSQAEDLVRAAARSATFSTR